MRAALRRGGAAFIHRGSPPGGPAAHQRAATDKVNTTGYMKDHNSRKNACSGMLTADSKRCSLQ